MSRSETDLPSIHTPLAHESDIMRAVARTSIDAGRRDDVAAPAPTKRGPTTPSQPIELATPVAAAREAHAPQSAGADHRAPAPLDPQPESSPEPELAADEAGGEIVDGHDGRAWPNGRRRDLTTPEVTNDQIEGGHHYRWEP
jgi:hypothetical protein